MEAPIVSVIMPAYNAERFIQTAIESVLAQTFQDFELIIVDDCSTDQTNDLICSYALKDARIVALQNAENFGVAATRNYAMSKARGEWIAFLDSDDLWRRDKLEKQMALIKEHPEAIVSYTASSFIDPKGTAYKYVLQAEPQIDYKRLLRMNLMSCSSVVVRRDIMIQFGIISEQMHEDYSTWLNILRKVPYAYGINEPLLIYRLSKNSKSGSRIKSARMIYTSYRYIGYSSIISALLMIRYSFYSIKKHMMIKIA